MCKVVLLLALAYVVLFNKINALDGGISYKHIDDLLYTGLILHAYGTAYKDSKALLPLTYHTITTLGTTYILKAVVNEKRPDYKTGDHRDSFPSGHASAAFIAPTFIHARYGFKKAIPTYLLATLVAYKRVEKKRHHVHDVIGGALVAYISSKIFIKNQQSAVKYSINGSFTPSNFNLSFNVKF